MLCEYAVPKNVYYVNTLCRKRVLCEHAVPKSCVIMLCKTLIAYECPKNASGMCPLATDENRLREKCVAAQENEVGDQRCAWRCDSDPASSDQLLWYCIVSDTHGS